MMEPERLQKNFAILVLAAGASRRMGKIKQLLPWNDTTMLGHAVQQALSCTYAQTFVVLGANASVIQARLALGKAQIVINADWHQGIGSSIAAGMRHIATSDIQFRAVTIMLADQPSVDHHHLKQIFQHYRNTQKKIVATAYDDAMGVPALFDRDYFPHLQHLDSDKGAQPIINKYSQHAIAIGSSHVMSDLDTYKAYLAAKNKK